MRIAAAESGRWDEPRALDEPEVSDGRHHRTVAPPQAAAAAASAPDVLAALLGTLDPEQRAAALLPDGPAQILAPAGSGKTTTLVARLGVLLDRGVAPERILVLTFNREAALELSARIAARLAPAVAGAAKIEVRTLHALGRQIVLDAGDTRRIVADRSPLLRAARRRVAARSTTPSVIPEADALDTAVSAWKLEGRPAGPEAREVIGEYQASLDAKRSVDFDDLIAGSMRILESRPALRARWQNRFSHLLVDEFQDVDAAQFSLVALLAEPERNLFVVGDDDQTIYAWRLADVRRMLDFGIAYPGATQVMLATNYRCPPDVVRASRQLIDHNRERFAKRIEAGARHVAGAAAIVTLATNDARATERLARLASGVTAAARLCFLARTRSELWPIALELLRAGIPHTTALPAPLEAAPVVELLSVLGREPPDAQPASLLQRLRRSRGWSRTDDALSADDHAALDAVLGWASSEPTVGTFLRRCGDARRRLAELRDRDAPVELVTVHGAKGREWQTVVILGWEEERFPNRRAIVQALDPARALEEERRLGYVALTRATGRVILVFDPARPSPFLAEMSEAVPPQAVGSGGA